MRERAVPAVFRPSRLLVAILLAFSLGLLIPAIARTQAVTPEATPAAPPDANTKQLQGVEAALAVSKQKAAALAAAAAALAKETAALQASLLQRAAARQAAERELNQLEATLATLEEARKAKADDLAGKSQAPLLSLAALGPPGLTPPRAVLS